MFLVKIQRRTKKEADWNAYAKENEAALAAFSEPPFLESKSYLLEDPPEHLDLVDGTIRWMPHPQRRTESDSQYLLRVVRDVRNNLFHGGKYAEPDGPVRELARNRRLIDSACEILEVCFRLGGRVQQMFDEAA
jgi:hypothetical protein